MIFESTYIINNLNNKNRFDPDIVGGESILLDSFEVAEEFREKYPKHFESIWFKF